METVASKLVLNQKMNYYQDDRVNTLLFALKSMKQSRARVCSGNFFFCELFASFISSHRGTFQGIYGPLKDAGIMRIFNIFKQTRLKLSFSEH